MDFFGSELFYRIICIVSAAVCAGAGIYLINISGVLKNMLSTFPKDMIPHHYLSVRSSVGTAYIFIGFMTLVRIWLDTPQHTEILFPSDGLVISASQIILATTALISLYDSPIINRRNILLNLSVFAILALAYVILWRYPVAKNAIRCIWFGFYLVQMILNTVVFFIERRKYIKAVTDRLGNDEAKKYGKKEAVVFFILSLLLAIWSCTSLLFPNIGSVSLFIAAYTVYYVFLGIYFHNQWEDSTLVQEIMSEANNVNY